MARRYAQRHGGSQYLAWNRGLVSPLALARADIDRIALSAETYVNFIPRVFGSAMLRPGTEYISTLSAASNFVPFIFSADDTALLQFTDSAMTVLVDESVITRSSVSTTIANDTFDSDLTSWTDADETGATSVWVTGGHMGLTGTGTLAAKRRQQVTIAGGDQGVEHGIKITVWRGPVDVIMGSSSGDDDYFSATLGTGTHSIAVTPTGASLWIEFSSTLSYQVLVTGVEVEGAGAISLTTPYGATDLANIRYDQSADVVYLACEGYQQYKVERRATRTWSVVLYEPMDGPWQKENTTSTTISASAISGTVTLTASQPLFKSTHVGSLFRLVSAGQEVTAAASAEDTFTDEIRTSGVEGTRVFQLVITGTWSGTVTLQRSLVEPGSWVDVQSWTTNQSLNYDDGLDNQVTYYRIGIKAGDYTSGTANMTLTYSGGSITGVAKIRTVTNSTSAAASVIDNLGGTDGTSLWTEGAWSGYRGWPTAVALAEGRLWWAGKDKVWGSVSDAFEGFDDQVEGDSGPISRSIGQGPVDVINWILPLERLMLGTASAEKVCKSSSFDEPLTPSAFSIKNASTQGSAKRAAVVIDTSGMFVQKSGIRVYALEYSGDKLSYVAVDMTRIVPLVCDPGVVNMAVQRQPDTRIHCVLSDGTVAVLVFDELEEVRCWVKVVTDGIVEQCVVLPGTEEDQVYYIVSRGTGRFLEKWSMESECQGGTTSKCLDSHVVYSGASTATITGLTHLEGETVYVWADGDSVDDTNGDPKGFTVSSGSITLDTAASDVVAGLTYTAQFKSTKLSMLGGGLLLAKEKIVDQVGLVLGPTHRQGLQYGPDFTRLDSLPLMEKDAAVTTDWTAYDETFLPFNGSWGTDSRVCLQAVAPRHCTLMGLMIDAEF